MKKEIKELFNQADECVQTFQVHTNVSFLVPILIKYNLLNLYNSKKDEIVVFKETFHDKDFTNNYILNVFEGCRHQSVTAAETRVALLFAIFYSHLTIGVNDVIMVETLEKFSYLKSIILEAIDEVNTNEKNEKFILSESDLLILKKCYNSTSIKYVSKISRLGNNNSDDVFKIVYDAYFMSAYMNSTTLVDKYLNLYSEHINSLTNDFKERIDNKASFDLFVEKLSRYSILMNWQSKWGKKKSFVLNWPVIINSICNGMKIKRYSKSAKTLAEIY